MPSAASPPPAPVPPTSDRQHAARPGPFRRCPAPVAIGIAVLAIVGLLLVRGMTYLGATDWAATLPTSVRTAFLMTSEYGLFALAALYGVGVLVARRHGVARLAHGVAAGVGVVVGYLLSEGVKLVVAELRPCRNFSVPTIASCPPATDWAWPSNHATLAAGIAVAVLIMVRGLGGLSLPIAALIAVSRVVVGVHYVHDVLAGALLGALVVAVCARWGAGPTVRLLTAIADKHRVLGTVVGIPRTGRRGVTGEGQSSIAHHNSSGRWLTRPARGRGPIGRARSSRTSTGPTAMINSRS